MSGVLLNLLIITGTTNYEIIMEQQEYAPIIMFAPLIGIITFLATLMETNRAPFDLSEAESDVVAGYAVEYAGILFGLFYLGEYLNLFTNSFILTIIFFGSWWSIYNYFDYIISTFKFFFIFCNLKYPL